MVKVQVFNMTTISDAELVAGTGADHIGTQVSTREIPYTVNPKLGHRICEVIKSSAKAVIIPISRDPQEILELARIVEPDIIQLANEENMMNRYTFTNLLSDLDRNGFKTISHRSRIRGRIREGQVLLRKIRLHHARHIWESPFGSA